jgi:hypothetical protein
MFIHDPNQYLPKKFDIIPSDPAYDKVPVHIKTSNVGPTKGIDIWYKQDSIFNRPKAIVTLKWFTDRCEFAQTPRGRAFTNLLQDMMKEQIRELNAEANFA